MTTLPHQPHSATSRSAAEQAAPRAETDRTKVLSFLKTATGLVSGATDDEMQRLIPMNPSSQRPRRVELVRLGLVRDTGMLRRTTSGRNATVWEAI